VTPIWLVTGAAGFLGMNVGVALRGRVDGVGVVRQHTMASPFDREVCLELRDATAIAERVREIRPDVIFHAAAVSGHETCERNPEEAYAVNVTATKAIAQAAAEIDARMVYISTDAVFSGAHGNYSEADEPEPFSLYGETKLAGEHAVLEAGSRGLVVRTNFFGWSSSGRRSVLEFFVNSLRDGQDVQGYPDFIVTSIYVQSLVDAVWQMVNSGLTGLIHVASSDAVSKHDFGVAVAEQFGFDASLISPRGAAYGGHSTSRSRDISLNTDLAASLRGEPLETQAAGIRRAYIEESTVGATLRATEEKQ
jgi:dTDP-4-dehydrorhamnose reductase